MNCAIVRIDRGDPESTISIEYLRIPASWEKAVQKLVRHAMRDDTAPNGEKYGMKAREKLHKAVADTQACMRILQMHQHACACTSQGHPSARPQIPTLVRTGEVHRLEKRNKRKIREDQLEASKCKREIRRRSSMHSALHN